jgi:hypothetical protein
MEGIRMKNHNEQDKNHVWCQYFSEKFVNACKTTQCCRPEEMTIDFEGWFITSQLPLLKSKRVNKFSYEMISVPTSMYKFYVFVKIMILNS